MGEIKIKNTKAFMRYAVARFIREQRETAYRIYLTDALRIISKNTGSYYERRFADILRPEIEDTRTGEEIVADIIERAGLEVLNEPS